MSATSRADDSAGNQRAGGRIPRLPALRNPSQRVRLREIARARINEKTSLGPGGETGRARALEAVAVRRCAGAGRASGRRRHWRSAGCASAWRSRARCPCSSQAAV